MAARDLIIYPWSKKTSSLKNNYIENVRFFKNFSFVSKVLFIGTGNRRNIVCKHL